MNASSLYYIQLRASDSNVDHFGASKACQASWHISEVVAMASNAATCRADCLYLHSVHLGSQQPSSVLLLGGTGALGGLTAAALWQDPTCHIMLVGRTGRGYLPGMQAANACVTVCCCEAASGRDSRHLIQTLRYGVSGLPGADTLGLFLMSWMSCLAIASELCL